VTVPENRATGSDKQIKLAVVRVKSTNENPGAPLLLGTGGPGGPGLQDVQGAGGPGFLTTYGPILEDREFVLFSQRGTALAEPMLDCPVYSALTIQASMEGMSLEARGQAGRDALVKCAEAFAAEGVDLSAYNTNENADDVDAIRQALGYDKIFYYGESYGTQLGQFVLRRHPDILAGILLDGIVPVTKEQSVRVSDIPGAFQTVFAACAADATCNAAYPDLEAMLVETMDRLRENPVSYTLALPGQEPVEVKVDDLLAMNALFIDLYVPGGYAKLPELVKQLHEGNMAPMRATLPLLLQTSSYARVMHYAINCTDDPTTSLDDLALDGVAEVYARLVTDDGQNYANICPALDLPQLPADSDALVESDIPALLLQGGLDPATPRSGGLNVAEGLPNSTEVLVPGGTHVQFGNPCVVNIVRNFMNDPAAKPDLSCIDQAVAFKLPAPVTYTGPGASNAISITLPPTFVQVAPGQWSDGEMIAITASFPPTKTVETVLGETAAALKMENPEVVDGPTIAGMESFLVQFPTSGAIYDVYVFGDEQGTYRVIFDALNASSVDFLREKVYPALLESVTVGPAQAAQSGSSNGEASNTPRLRELDFAPFEAALAAFTPERAAKIEAIVKDADIAQVQDAVKAGQLSYAELTLFFLLRIKQYDETLRTMVELNPDALKEAQAADQLLKDGKATDLMFGIPVTLKDNIETAAPMHTTGGSEILSNYQPKADASFVKQLREAGAVILGKANLSEFAGGITVFPPGASAVGGVTMNPYGDFSAGGSSSGSGAGTAAYETMVSVGSETAGSLIVPASWNGVVGMYPSKGVVDGSQVIPLITNNDSAGPIGRNVKDVATLLGVIDTRNTDYVAGLDAQALNGVKAAFLKADVLAQPTSPLEDTADNAAIAQLIEQGLTKAGAKVSDVEFAPAQIGAQLNGVLATLIAGGIRHDMLPYLTAAGVPVKTPEDLAAYNLKDPQTRIPFQQGTLDSSVANTDVKDAAEYQDAITQIKAAAVATLEQAFADSQADILVSVNNYHSQVYATANYPAITIPLGKRANGMPVGVVLIGKPGSEAQLLSYAYALEQATKLRVDPDLSRVEAH
jgi:amidase